jgi:ribosomal protein S18 acetylase RimI-like enzyme
VSDAPCRVLDWDSAFFGCRVAQVEGGRLDAARCAAVLDWCRRSRVDWLYFLADANDAPTVRAAEGAGFDFMDLRVELVLDLAWPRLPAPAPPPEFVIRPAQADDLSALRSIAADVHTDSRFFFDPRVPVERARCLYMTWIERSVLERFADHVLVAEREGRACAYVTGRHEAAGHGHIGLVGVGADARGRGVGIALVHALLERFGSRAVETVTVVTQGRNIMAQRVYQRCGFLSQSLKLWFHKWFK